MTTARHRCFSLLMAKDQFTSYMTSHYDRTQSNNSKFPTIVSPLSMSPVSPRHNHKCHGAVSNRGSFSRGRKHGTPVVASASINLRGSLSRGEKHISGTLDDGRTVAATENREIYEHHHTFIVNKLSKTQLNM